MEIVSLALVTKSCSQSHPGKCSVANKYTSWDRIDIGAVTLRANATPGGQERAIAPGRIVQLATLHPECLAYLNLFFSSPSTDFKRGSGGACESGALDGRGNAVLHLQRQGGWNTCHGVRQGRDGTRVYRSPEERL